jgi:hypothetical protein
MAAARESVARAAVGDDGQIAAALNFAEALLVDTGRACGATQAKRCAEHDNT